MTIIHGLIAALVIALALAGWGLKHQTERVGGLESENATLVTALDGAAQAYADLGTWMLAKDQAAARALAAKQLARAKTAAINEGIDHAPVSCPALLDAAFDGLRAQYQDDPGGQAGQDGAGGRADDGRPGPGYPAR